jgi:hypothetical protein
VGKKSGSAVSCRFTKVQITSKRTAAADAQVVMLLNMTRSFMRGLLTQEQYGVSPEETLSYVEKWIELIAPLLQLRKPVFKLIGQTKES